MRKFFHDKFVRRFIGGFAFGLIGFAAIQAHSVNAAGFAQAETFSVR